MQKRQIIFLLFPFDQNIMYDIHMPFAPWHYLQRPEILM